VIKTGAIVLLCIGLLNAGCRREFKAPPGSPTVEFTSIPLAGGGDPKQVSTVKGRADGVRPGEQIVIYARGEDAWWVQPFANNPFTQIQRDLTWENSTHPGTDYAALLVGADFHPPLTADVLPTDGVFAVAVAHGEPPLWRRWWFPFLVVAAFVALIFGLYRLRLHQLTRRLNLRFEERLSERMRVAQELHDTLFQGLLGASMQLHVAVKQLPANSPAQASLEHVLKLMGQVVDEGRNTLRGLRSRYENPRDLELAFQDIRRDLSIGEDMDFRVIVEGSPLPLRSTLQDDIYNITREALLNAFRHSRATAVAVELRYARNQMRIVVRDNGCGIDSQVLHAGRDGHFGLTGMRERAKRIGGRLKVWSRPGAGTEVELCVPSHIAFESQVSRSRFDWLKKFYIRAAAKGNVQAISTDSRGGKEP
jgi:signal transduction histidine kinase